MRAVCSVTQCPQISSTDDFEIESNGVPFTCCPQPKYIACKQNDKTYKVLVCLIILKYNIKTVLLILILMIFTIG